MNKKPQTAPQGSEKKTDDTAPLIETAFGRSQVTVPFWLMRQAVFWPWFTIRIWRRKLRCSPFAVFVLTPLSFFQTFS